jgi:hypothetical protein
VLSESYYILHKNVYTLHTLFGYSNVLSRVWVTIDGVWIGDSIYWPLVHSLLVTTLYRSLTHRDYCPHSITVSSSPFLATDFNTGTVTLSLNYTLQMSHIKSSLYSRTFNWEFLQLTICPKTSRLYHLGTDYTENTALILLCLDSLPQRCVYRDVA